MRKAENKKIRERERNQKETRKQQSIRNAEGSMFAEKWRKTISNITPAERFGSDKAARTAP